MRIRGSVTERSGVDHDRGELTHSNGDTVTSGFGDTGMSGGHSRIPEIVSEILAGGERYLSGLADMGIHFAPTCGLVEVDPLSRRTALGHLVRLDNGDIEISQREGLTQHQLADLVLQAQHAKLHGPDTSAGWGTVDGIGWTVSIYQPVAI